MESKLSLIASVSVIALASYGAWLLADVDKAQIVSLNDTVRKITDTLGGPVAPVATDDKTKTLLYSGIAILIVATLYTLLKKSK